MSTIEQKKAPFAEIPVADFVGTILDGGERADEAMYYLLQHILYLPLRRRYEIVQHLLFDDFDDILNDFFFHLWEGNAIRSGHDRAAEETGGDMRDVHPASDNQLPYPSLRRIRNRQAFVQWMLRTFRNYLLMRTAKEGPLVCSRLSADNLSVSSPDSPSYSPTDIASDNLSDRSSDRSSGYVSRIPLTAQLATIPTIPYEAKYSKMALWNMLERVDE